MGVNPDIDAARRRYYDRLDGAHLAPLWEFFADWFTPVPRVEAVPYVWRYSALRELVLESASLIDPAEAERRVVVLENPGLPGRRLVTRSLYAGLQVILPGEVAPCHRHSPVALRFVVEGEGAYTAIDGERAYMRPGDMIVTPPWAWHEHGHEGEGPTVWLDVLDVAMIHLFNASFAELRPRTASPPASARYGRLPVTDTGGSDTDSRRPTFSFAYSSVRAALERQRDGGEPDPCHGYRFEYLDSLSRAPVIPTISTFMQLLPAGFDTERYRTTASTLYCFVEGSGLLTAGDGASAARFDYSPWDLIVVPSWLPIRIEPAAETVVFSASDEIAQKKLGYWREARASEA